MRKRIVSLVLVLTFILGICPGALATTRDAGVYYVDHTETLPLSAEDINKYQQYAVAANARLFRSGETNSPSSEDVLRFCTLIDTRQAGNSTIKRYDSESLSQYLYNCDSIVEIAESDGLLYITYETRSHEVVYLTYTDVGLSHQLVYDSEEDTAYILTRTETIKELNFRQGVTEIISDELLDVIYSCIRNNDYAAIENNPLLSMEVDENNDVVIAPAGQEGLARTGTYTGFTNETDLLNSLKADFPYQNKSVSHSSSIYCQYLSRNINFRVVNTRNGYVRTRADARSYAADTAITVIGAFLGVPTSYAELILLGLDVAMNIVNGVKLIAEAVKLYRGATYTYNYERYGLVYDSTRFNDYVKVYQSMGGGTFHGGYNSQNEFEWVRTLSTPETKSTDEIKSTCTSRYNAELNVYGWCESYYPL